MRDLNNRKRTNTAGIVIVVVVTLISAVSSFVIYRESFADFPPLVQNVFAALAVVVVEGAFCWLIDGYARTFSSGVERAVSIGSIVFLFLTMAVNVVTHAQIAKGTALTTFQHGWINWGAVTVFLAVLALALVIRLADPIARLQRLELKIAGVEQEAILHAREEALNSDSVKEAIKQRIAREAQRIASQIVDNQQRSVGFQPVARHGEDDAGKGPRR